MNVKCQTCGKETALVSQALAPFAAGGLQPVMSAVIQCDCGCTSFVGTTVGKDSRDMELAVLRKRVQRQRAELKRLNNQVRLYWAGLRRGVQFTEEVRKKNGTA